MGDDESKTGGMAQRGMNGETASVRLEPMMDLAAAKGLFDEILASRGGKLVIDASAVRHLGAQCAQILMSALATWRVEGHAFEIVGSSPAFADGARILGLAPFLLSEG